MKPFPIQIRLTAWYSAILAVVLCLFGVSAYLEMRNSIHQTVDEALQDRVRGVRGLIERNSAYGDDEVRRELRQHSELAGGALLQVSDPHGNSLYRSARMSEFEIPTTNGGPAGPFTFSSRDTPFRVVDAEIKAGNQSYLVQVAAPLDDFYDALHRFATLLLVSIPILLLCAAGGGYWLSRRALAPFDQIAQTARSVGIQNLSSRLVVPQTRDVLQRLSETFNSMLERLEAAFKKITQFTADASHELRTPIAVMRTRAELSLRNVRTADEYREALRKNHSDLEKTSDLVEKLMLLARADYGAEVLQLSATNLVDIVREACSQGRTLSEAKQISFDEQIPDFPVLVKADAHALRRLLLILIDNAIKYTPTGGRVEVLVSTDNGSALAAVRDTGIGIATEDLPNVFERFYRADKARSRQSGGVGLGLSIGSWIAEAHAGAIEVQSTLGQGSIFQVRLPLAIDEIEIKTRKSL
jgi:heavy metal sensor kinase